ncbi:MAG: DinB family protein [Chloroflexi bacterium]|nr:DinB family protein [Chloroflexota bacterium]MCI0578763.1 DinB family protein [Chloroflexota bacterium]MCI0648740.1 DinB family protein [Chloroflexota bacterium]MCI0731668.1 DinB family protein [Chloroflexota bacterium]
MTHPLIDQFRFTRREWLRGLEGVSEEDAVRHFGPMNCISWIVGHLAWHEHRYWLELAQGKVLFPELNTTYAYGAPMCTPSLKEMLATWRQVTQAADSYLDTLTSETLQQELLRDGKAVGQSIGSALRRITYHYWFHVGEIQAIRQMLGQANLPEYVGNIEQEAPYRPEE